MKLQFTIMVAVLLFSFSIFAQTKININSAPADELVKLKGIGKVKSKRIIEYRQKNGLFETVDDIVKVKGIGKKTLSNIRDMITVGNAKDDNNKNGKKTVESSGLSNKKQLKQQNRDNKGKININIATFEQLVNLPGLSKSKARRVIDYRKNKGRFKSIKDIMKVKGIGKGTFLKLKDKITVNSSSVKRANKNKTGVFVKFDLNLMSLKELVAIPGMDTVKAKAVLEYREKHKRFNKLKEIKNVLGIDEKIYQELIKRVYVLPAKKPNSIKKPNLIKTDVEKL